MATGILAMGVLILIGGTILNIAVAWSCAAFIDPSSATPQFTATDRADGGHDAVSVARRFGRTRIGRARLSILTLDPVTDDIQSAAIKPMGNEYSEDRAGWPCRSLRCVNHAEIHLATASSSIGMRKSGLDSLTDGIELTPFAASIGSWRALPLRPLWPGFIANSLFYALLLWLLFFAPFALRRLIRRRRGLCERCAYPIGESPVCTECGAAIARGRVA